MRKNQDGFSLVEGLLIFIIVAFVFFVGWYVWHSKAIKTTGITPTTTSAINSATTFSGKVTADNCVIRTSTTDGNITTAQPSIGDAGCSITVNNVKVLIVHGNIKTSTWGNLIGFTYSTNIVGKQVEVHATKISDTQFSLQSTGTYVRVLN